MAEWFTRQAVMQMYDGVAKLIEMEKKA